MPSSAPGRARTLVLALLLLVLPGLPSRAAEGPPPKPASTSPGSRPPGTRPSAGEASARHALEHRLIGGDEVEIHILALPDLERMYRLRSDGGLYHPLAGEIQAAGMTLRDLQALVEKRLARELRNPAVRVGLKSLARQDVTILGEVSRPGKYEVLPGSTVLDVLAMAGGNTPDADLSTAVLMREGASQTISLMPPDPAATQAENAVVAPGDILYVLAGTRVSVSGDVAKPGVYALPRAGSDPWKALQAAGGPKAGAALNRVVLQRATLTAPILVDLSTAGVELPEAARQLQPGDTLRVPERQVLLLGGVGKAGPITLEAGDTVLDVIMRAGLNDPKRLDDVTIIRAEDVRAGRQKTEKHDLTAYVEKGDTSVLVPVFDGDVVYVPAPPQSGQGPLNLLNLLMIGRTIFGFF